MITLILGGAKSGKSAFALSLAESMEGKRAFIATAQVLDEEMAVRIARHRAERSDLWETFEEPFDIAPLITKLCASYSLILVDCLTLWMSNIMLSGRDCASETEWLLRSIKNTGGHVFFVSNELGLGIVPENRLARQFRDYAGALNQAISAEADDVYFIVAGIPIKIKEKRL